MGPTAFTPRLTWEDLPPRLQREVCAILGGDVISVNPQTGGFSPGTADRVRTDTGAAGFVKAVSPAQNPDTPELLRREAMVLATMPAELGVPRLLGSYDDGEWVLLVVEDVDGRHPHTPWRPEEARAVLTALGELQRHTAPRDWRCWRTSWSRR